MKTFLCLLLFAAAVRAQDDLAPLSDEFDDAASLSDWQRLYQTEGWVADQLETWDIDTSRPGHMRLMPHTSAWYNNLRGALAYKPVSGDFVVTARLRVSSRSDPSAPPSRLFSLAGLFAFAPRGISSAAPTPYTPASVWPPASHGSDWQPNTDNYIFLSYGSAGNAGTWQYEVKTTLHSDSNLYFANSGVPDSGEIELQMVRVGQTVVVLRRHPGGNWIVENRYPNPSQPLPAFGNDLYVGITAYTDWNLVQDYWNGGDLAGQFHHNYSVLDGPGAQPDVIADVDYVRYRRPSPLLTEAMLQALPTAYDPGSGQSTAVDLPATGAGEFLGDQVEGGPPVIGFVQTAVEISEIAGDTVSLAVHRGGGQSDQAVTVSVAISGGSGDASDVQLLTHSLHWPANDNSPRHVVVESQPDEVHEGDETVEITLSGAGVVFGEPTAVVTVIDDDTTPGFPNIARTPGELIAGLIAPTQGRTAILAYHNSLLYSVPEMPSSFGPSDWQVRTWDITHPAAPQETAQLGLTPHPVNAHGYFKSGDYLAIGPNWPPESPWSFRADGPGATTRTELPGNQIPGNRGDLYAPWYVGQTYWSYNAIHGNGEVWKRGQLLGSWDHLAETGVIGHPILIGNLLIFASDQSRTGVATYDISDPAHPVLLDVLKTGGPGGYWPEPFALDGHLYLVFPYRTGGNGIRVVDATDPGDLRFVADVPLPGDECMYVQFQDEFAFTGSHKVDMRTFQSVLNLNGANTVRTNDGGTGIDTSQFALPIGNLLVTGGVGPNQGMAIWAHQAAPDTRGPSVAFHIPRAGQTHYPRGAAISLVIHETLETPTMKNGHTFIVRPVGGEPVPGWITYAFNDTLTFTPDEDLLPDTEYEVIVPAGGIKDAAGNGIEGYQFSFSTGGTLGGNLPPSVDAFTADPYPALAGDPIAFAAAASDPEAQPLDFRFDFGDGSDRTPWGPSAQATHSYAAPGHYRAKAQVRDAGGLIATRSLTVTVLAALPSVQRPVQSTPILVDESGRRVYTVNPDNHSLSAVNADTLELLYETRTGRGPRSVALDAHGQLWIACMDDDVLDCVRATDGALLARYALGYGSGPFGVVARGGEVWASLSGAGEIRRFNALTGQENGRVAPGPTPRALALSADGTRLYAARFLSDPWQGHVWEMDAQSMGLLRTLVIPKFGGDAHRDGTASGKGVANSLRSVTLSPDGQHAWVTAKKDNTDRGSLTGPDLNVENTVRAIACRIDLASGQFLDAIDLDNSDSPAAFAYSALGDYFFVALQGNNALAAFDALGHDQSAGLGSLVLRTAVGAAPQGIAVDGPGQRAFVKNFLGRSISVLDLSAFNAIGNIALPGQEIPVVGQERLAPSVLQGKRIFYHADERMSAEGYISCATCHLDGGHDGRVWDFTGRGEGLRRTTDLRGRAGTAHGAVHWSGNFDEIQDFENDIRNAFGGTGFLSDADFAATQSPLGAPKAGLSAELDALADYVASLAASSVPRSPHREPNGDFTAAALAGQAVFASVNCASCHSGAAYTDSALPGGSLHDVGTLRPSSGQRLGQPLAGIDTPTLRGLHAATSYFHDGSARTLADVFSTTGGNRLHAEDGVVTGGAQIIAQYVELNNDDTVRGRALAYMDNWNGRLAFHNVDGGGGGIGAVEIRYSGAGQVITLAANGVDIPLAVPGTPNNPGWKHNQWRNARFEGVTLLPGPANHLEFRASIEWSNFSIDEILVCTPEHLAQAHAHRQVLDLTQGEIGQLLAFLRSLDGGTEEHAFMKWAMDQGKTNLHPDLDDDHDNIGLQAEWMRGMDANAADAEKARVGLQAFEDGGEAWMSLAFRRAGFAPGVVWTAQTSSNLVEWIDHTPDGGDIQEVVLDPDPDGDGSAVDMGWLFRLAPEAGQLFYRMEGRLAD